MLGTLAGSPRRRLAIGATLVLLLFFVAGMWVARTDVKPQFLPPPAKPIFPEPVVLSPSSGIPSAVPTPTSTPSASPSPSPSSLSPSPTHTSKRPRTSPSARRTTKPAPPAAFEAEYLIMRSRDSNRFQVGIVVRNEGTTTRSWRIQITHNPDDGVRVQRGMGAGISSTGNSTTVTGGPLPAGRTAMVAFSASKRTRGVARPTSCRVEGRECDVSVR